MDRGTFIVIEGGDGAGKATQTKLAAERLRREGRRVETISFPQYGKPSAVLVEKYLRGEFGPKESLSPFVKSAFYASDRLAAAAVIRQWLEEGAVVLSDRYAPSNIAHQGADLGDPAARAEFIRWLEDFEYGRLGIPRPDLTVVLASSASVRDANVEKKSEREYLAGAKKDIHEGDVSYQEKVERIYREIAVTLPGYVLVDCSTPDGGMHPAEICHDLVWPHIDKRLAAP